LEKLLPAGVTTVRASTGIELTELLRQQGPFDLVVAGSELPLQSGIEALARARDEGHTAPFLVVQGASGSALRVLVSEVGSGPVLSSRVVDDRNLGDLIAGLLGLRR